MPDATDIIMHQKSEKSVNYGCNKGFLYVAPERYTSDSATPQRDVHGRIAPVVVAGGCQSAAISLSGVPSVDAGRIEGCRVHRLAGVRRDTGIARAVRHDAANPLRGGESPIRDCR